MMTKILQMKTGPKDPRLNVWLSRISKTNQREQVLALIRLPEYKHLYHFNPNQRTLLSHLMSLYIAYQDHNRARFDEDLVINNIKFISKKTAKLKIETHQAHIKKLCEEMNDFPLPTVLIASLVGEFDMVLKYIKNHDLPEFKNQQDLVEMLFEPYLGLDSDIIERGDFLYPSKHINPQFHYKYSDKIRFLNEMLVNHPSRLSFNKNRSTCEFLSANLLHLFIKDAVLFTKKEFDMYKVTLRRHKKDQVSFEFNNKNHRKFLKVYQKLPDVSVSDFNELYELEKNILEGLILNSDINQAASDNPNKKNDLLLGVTDCIHGITPLYEAVRSGKHLALEVLLKAPGIDLNIDMKTKPYAKDDAYISEPYYYQKPFHTRRSPKDAMFNHYHVLPRSEKTYSSAEYIALNNLPDVYFKLIQKGMKALDIHRYIEKNGHIGAPKDIFQLTELYNNVQKDSPSDVKSFYLKEWAVSLYPVDKDSELINRCNNIESNYVFNFQNNDSITTIPDEVDMNGMSAIDLIRMEVSWNRYFLKKIREIPKNKKRNKSMRDHELEKLYKRVSYVINNDVIEVSLKPRIGHAGNCFVGGLPGKGTYQDIITSLSNITQNSPSKEKAIAHYFLLLASGERAHNIAHHLRNVGLSEEHDSILHHVYYLVVIREVSRRYHTGSYLDGSYPMVYPFCIAQYCALNLVVNGSLKFEDILSQDARYGLPTGSGVCIESNRDRSVNKLTRVLRKHILSLIPSSIKYAYKYFSADYLLGLTESGYQFLFRNFITGPIDTNQLMEEREKASERNKIRRMLQDRARMLQDRAKSLKTDRDIKEDASNKWILCR